MAIEITKMIFMALLPIVGMAITRIHGSALHVPRWIIQSAWGICFGMPFQNITISLIAFTASYLGLATGHGRGQSLPEPMRGDHEKVEFVTLWAMKYLPLYWYKVLIMAVWGIATTSGGWLAFLLTGQFLSAAICAFGGTLCAAGYMLGWGLYNRGFRLLEPTQIGEILTGFFGGVALSIAWGISRY